MPDQYTSTSLAILILTACRPTQVVTVLTYWPWQVYNAILRQYPPEVFGKFKAGGNLFATTIHVLVSAVIKIARVTKLPAGLELYRGLGGLAQLPDSFFQTDANGCRGYAEWGFLSTTSNETIAVEVCWPFRASR
jgi:hypothetical protein